MKDSTFSSSAYGVRDSVFTYISGRVTFDVIKYMRRNHKLSSYSLNNVSSEILGQQKEDVHHRCERAKVRDRLVHHRCEHMGAAACAVVGKARARSCEGLLACRPA